MRALLFTAVLGFVSSWLHCPARAHDACRDRADTLGWYAPDHAKLQTGGQLGMITLGIGYEAYDVIDFDVYYGWVPAAVGGTDIHSAALRIGGHVPPVCLSRTVRWTYLRGAIGAVMTMGRGFFLNTPDRYPYNYPETLARAFLALGTALAIRQPESSLIASHGAFAEVTALDRYAIAWLQNENTPSFWEIWSVSLGYEAGF